MKSINPVGKGISMLYRYGQIYINDALKRYNISSGQYLFLINLYENEGINQDHLSELLKIDKATTARAVRRLVEEGYVLRKINPQDKRSYELYVTKEGHKLKEPITHVLRSWRAITQKGLSEEETELFLQILEHMKDNALTYFQENSVSSESVPMK